VKPSGAPDVGDLVMPKDKNHANYPNTGIVIECRGIECWVLWSPSMQFHWWQRNKLEVIGESR